MNYIVDNIGAVVAAMQTDSELVASLTTGIAALSTKGYAAGMPYYMYGHRLEIANRLMEKGKDSVYKFQKYPLVALRLDTSEDFADGVITYKLNVALIMLTDKKWDAEQRYVNVFKPVLYPMYQSFLKQLKNVGLFMWESTQDNPPHTKIDRPYWGTEESERNSANIFNDPLDAIELLNLEIKQNYKC